MKKIKIIILLVATLGATSCGNDFLSPAPISSIAADSFYSTEKELLTGVINMYDGIQGINPDVTTGQNNAIQIEYQVTEMRSDNTRTKSSEGEPAQFQNFNVLATNSIVANYYTSFYNVIFRANIVLENLGVASAAKAAAFEGEAKFVRGYAYFNLVRLYGDIPIADKVITPSDEATVYTRRPISDVYNLIISDLTTAVATLDNIQRNRASKAAAQTLLAKVHLTLGNYSDAKLLLEAVIAGGVFSLEPNFKDVFFKEANKEVIFGIGFIGDNVNDSQNFSAEMAAQGRSSGLNYLTNEMLVAFASFGGAERIAVSYRTDAATPTQTQVQKFVSTAITSLGVTTPTSTNLDLAGNDWIVLRYADVLLMHVESILAGGASTSDPAALASFQAVRDRAELKTPVTSISKQELMDERRVELAFENHRLFDLIRFNEAQNVLSKYATDNGRVFSGSDLLLPIPQREISLSRGLMTQNPIN